MDSFPPIDFSIGSTSSSSSPPRGRQRQEILKRPRSLESDELESRKSSKTAPVDNQQNTDNIEHETPIQDDPTLSKATGSNSAKESLLSMPTGNSLN